MRNVLIFVIIDTTVIFMIAKERDGVNRKAWYPGIRRGIELKAY